MSGDATPAELLVQPLKLNDAKAGAALRALLVESGAITLVSHSQKAFERAAELRAKHALKMVDALNWPRHWMPTPRASSAMTVMFPSLPGLNA